MLNFSQFVKKYFPKAAEHSDQVIVDSVALKCHKLLAPKAAPAVVLPSPGKHLVIIRIIATMICPTCGKPKILAHIYKGRTFHSLIEAEVYRSSTIRLTANEARLISSKAICAEYVTLAQQPGFQARQIEGAFLALQFNAAKAPALN